MSSPRKHKIPGSSQKNTDPLVFPSHSLLNGVSLTRKLKFPTTDHDLTENTSQIHNNDDTEDFTKNQSMPLLMKNTSGKLRFFNTLQKQAPVLVPEPSLTKITTDVRLRSIKKTAIHHSQNETNADHEEKDTAHDDDDDDDDDDDGDSDMSIDAVRRGADTAQPPLPLDVFADANHTVNSSIVESPLQNNKINFPSTSKITSRKRSFHETLSPLKNVPQLTNSNNKNQHSSGNKENVSFSNGVSFFNEDNSPGVQHQSKPLNKIPALSAPSPNNQSSPMEIKMISPERALVANEASGHKVHTRSKSGNYAQLDNDNIIESMNLSPLGSMVKRRRLSQPHSHSQHLVEALPATLKDLHQSFNRELLSYKETVEEKNSKIFHLLDSTHQLESDLAKITDKYDHLKFEKSEILKNYEIAHLENSTSVGKLKDLEEKMIESASKIEELSNENEKLSNLKIALNDEKNSHLIEISNLNSNFKTLELELDNLLNEKNQEEEEHKKLEAKLESLEKLNEQHVQEVEDLKNKLVKNSKDENESLQKKLEDLQMETANEIKTLEDLLDKETAELKNKNEQILGVQKLNKDLQEKVDEYENKITSLKDLVENLQLDLKYKEEQIQNLSTSSSTKSLDLDNQIKTLEEKNNKSRKEYEDNILSLKQEMSTLKESADKSKNERPALESKISELQKIINQTDQETNKKLQSLAEDLYAQYSSKHEQKVKILKNNFEKKYQDQVVKMRHQTTAAQEELAMVKKQLEHERKEKENLLQMWEQQSSK
ncbi:hypothetical protein ACO0RG_002826 [Hanseniaspora osmophila]